MITLEMLARDLAEELAAEWDVSMGEDGAIVIVPRDSSEGAEEDE